MKVIIINGSARKGNTLTAIKAFVKGASEKNEIEIIEPDKLNIAPCKGCGACQCSKGCVDKDDTNPTIDKIAAADMILFATPVYWWGMSAQLISSLTVWQNIFHGICFSRSHIMQQQRMSFLKIRML